MNPAVGPLTESASRELRGQLDLLLPYKAPIVPLYPNRNPGNET